MTNDVLWSLGIQPRTIQSVHQRPRGPVADCTNYAHEAVINLVDSRTGETSEFMVRMGVRNEGSRKSYILWGERVGREMNPYHWQDPDYFSVVAMEIADRAPLQASWYSGRTQQDRAYETAEGDTFKYRQRTFTRLTSAELAAFDGNAYTEVTP